MEASLGITSQVTRRRRGADASDRDGLPPTLPAVLGRFDNGDGDDEGKTSSLAATAIARATRPVRPGPRWRRPARRGVRRTTVGRYREPRFPDDDRTRADLTGFETWQQRQCELQGCLAYVGCMRSHGVANFPDPTSSGALNVDFQTGGKGGGSPVSSGINRNSAQYILAAQACRHLLPGGVPTPAQAQQALATGLKFAQCMRGHGVPNFPDPTTAGVVHLGADVDMGSPQFQDAAEGGQSLVPGAAK